MTPPTEIGVYVASSGAPRRITQGCIPYALATSKASEGLGLAADVQGRARAFSSMVGSADAPLIPIADARRLAGLV